MKWSKLTGLLVATVGSGVLCCSGAHLFGRRLPHIQNAMDSLSGWSFVALDIFAVLLMTLGYFVCRARNWARLTVMGGCTSWCVMALAVGVWLAVEDATLRDAIYLLGTLMWFTAPPLFLFFVLRQPEVAQEFKANANTLVPIAAAT